MMKILNFIIICVLVNILHGTNIPKRLNCVDDTCSVTISTGRLITTVNPVYGNLKTIKSSAKILVRGKNYDTDNTLWLVESDGLYGFVDMSFVKENKHQSREDLSVVKNPYYNDKLIDETEDKDEIETNGGLFSSHQNSAKNYDDDETESLSDEMNSDADKNTDGNLNVSNGTKKLVDLHVENNVSKLDENVLNNSESSRILVENSGQKLDKENALSKPVVTDNSIKDEKEVKIEETEVINQQQQMISSKQEEVTKTTESQDNVDLKSDIEKPIQKQEFQQVFENLTSKENVSPKEESDSEKMPANESKNVKVPQEIEPNLSASKDVVESNEIKTKEEVKKPLGDIQSKETTNPIYHETNLKKESQDNSVKKRIEDTQPEEDILQKRVNEANKNVEGKDVSSQSQSKVEPNNMNSKSDVQDVLQKTVNNVETAEIQGGNIEEKILSGKDAPMEKDSKSTLHRDMDENQEVKPQQPQNLTGKNGKSTENTHSAEPSDQKAPEVQKLREELINKPDTKSENNEKNQPHKSITGTLSNINQSKVETKSINSEQHKTEKLTKNIVKNPIISSSETDPKTSIQIDNGPSKEQAIKENMSSEKIESKPIDSHQSNESLIKSVEIKANQSENEKLTDKKSTDPWLKDNSDSDGDALNHIRSPVLKIIFKLDSLIHSLIKSIMTRFGFDSHSELNRFSNSWLRMPLENLISILFFFSVMLFVIYSPKIFQFNRDWETEFSRQARHTGELEAKLQSIEEVRHKLTVQNHNFEKVIEEYKQKINEIQEDASKNKTTVLMELEKVKKTNEINIKTLSIDLDNKTRQCELFEKEIGDNFTEIETLREQHQNAIDRFSHDKLVLDNTVKKLEEQLKTLTLENERLDSLVNQKSIENEDLQSKIDGLKEEIHEKQESMSELEKCFDKLKSFESLNAEELETQKSISLQLTKAEENLKASQLNINQLTDELKSKINQITTMEDIVRLCEEKSIESEKQRFEAVQLKEAAEMKLNVLSDYFKSKEVEMAKKFGCQVIESTQSMDQVEFLKHRIEILGTENSELSKTIEKLKSEVKEAQSFASKIKMEASEQTSNYILKTNGLERSLATERDENKKLRMKLSHYCGPIPPRNASSPFNHNKDSNRPPSRQSGLSEPQNGALIHPPLMPSLPFLPLSPIPNPTFSGRNSVNSKKSNNT